MSAVDGNKGMSHYSDNAYNKDAAGELTLQPREIKEEPVSGAVSSRDRRQHVDIAANSAGPETATGVGRKPAGKANFLTDDRQNSERRNRERRKNARLTGDRRGTLTRRAVKNPWTRGQSE
jgi:hypothetical protein